jgi:multicomponent Na+:H+ antiporter subunit A
MAAFLLLFGLISILTPVLTRTLSTRVFYLIALLPAAAFVFTITQTGPSRPVGP